MQVQLGHSQLSTYQIGASHFEYNSLEHPQLPPAKGHLKVLRSRSEHGLTNQKMTGGQNPHPLLTSTLATVNSGLQNQQRKTYCRKRIGFQKYFQTDISYVCIFK